MHGLDDVFVVVKCRQNKNLGGRHLFVNDTRSSHAIATGHPDVHQHHVRLERLGHRHCLVSVACLTDNLKVCLERQQRCESLSHQCLIVDNENSYHNGMTT